MRKTARDVRLEREAAEITYSLDGRIVVNGGGRKGPFAVSVARLSRDQTERIIKAILAILETPA